MNLKMKQLKKYRFWNSFICEPLQLHQASWLF